MKRNFKLFAFCLILISGKVSFAQEILLNVIIDDQLYNFADKTVLNQVKSDLEDFVNNRQWTEDNFADEERINLSILLTVQSASSATNFVCTAQIQSTRPVYNSAYETVLLNYIDKEFNFNYTLGMNLEYNDNAYTTELTTLIAFYAYLTLALDYDSFSEGGGNSYYMLANQALNNHPNPSQTSWEAGASDPNTRYWLIENALNPQFQLFHNSIYEYHRLGLDIISEKQAEAQQIILKSLETIKSIRELNQTSILISSFMLGKRTELVAIFKGADKATKDKALLILRFLDPANSEAYIKITE